MPGGFGFCQNGITCFQSFSHQKHLPGLGSLGEASWSLDTTLGPSQLRILSDIYPSSPIFLRLAYLERDLLCIPLPD